MGSPFLDYNELTALASQGGYTETPTLSQLTSVFLLSACVYLREKWLWQSPLEKIPNSLYEQILEMIEQAEYELMANPRIGQIMPSVALISDPAYVAMVGQLLPVANYPELAAVVPASWIVGTDIQLPNMTAKGLFGAVDVPTIGVVAGENLITLTEAQMPVHTHVQNAHSHGYSLTTAIPTAAGLEPTFADLTTQVPAVTDPTVSVNQNAGGGEAHLNVPESLLVVWYIVAR
jgi:microcystin-dependent protein